MLREFPTVQSCYDYWGCSETTLGPTAAVYHSRPRRALDQDLDMQKQVIDNATYLDNDNKDYSFYCEGADLIKAQKTVRDKVKRWSHGSSTGALLRYGNAVADLEEAVKTSDREQRNLVVVNRISIPNAIFLSQAQPDMSSGTRVKIKSSSTHLRDINRAQIRQQRVDTSPELAARMDHIMAARTHIQQARQDQKGASSERFAVHETLPSGHRKDPMGNGQVDDIIYREDPQLIIDRDEMTLCNDDLEWIHEDRNGDPDSSDDDWDTNNFIQYCPRLPPGYPIANWEPPDPPEDPRPHQAPPGLTLTKREHTDLAIQRIIDVGRPNQQEVAQDTAGAASSGSTWNDQQWYTNHQSDQQSDWYARPQWNPGTDASWQSQSSWWNRQDHHWQNPNQWY